MHKVSVGAPALPPASTVVAGGAKACLTAAMVDAAAVRRLARAHAGVADESPEGELRFSVGGKGFAWTYYERVEPKKPRRPRPDVLAVRCPIERKELLIEAAPQIFFDDDHYRGYPAVLVRLAAVGEDELAALLEAGWRLQSSKKRRKPPVED